MSLFANPHELAQQREIEDLRQEIGRLRHENEQLGRSLRIAHDDVADLSHRLKRAQERGTGR